MNVEIATLEILKALVINSGVLWNSSADDDRMIKRAKEIATKYMAAISHVEEEPTAYDEVRKLLSEGKTVEEIKAMPIWDTLTEAEKCAAEGKPFKGAPSFQPVTG
jgi:hypothetical protein